MALGFVFVATLTEAGRPVALYSCVRCGVVVTEQTMRAEHTAWHLELERRRAVARPDDPAPCAETTTDPDLGVIRCAGPLGHTGGHWAVARDGTRTGWATVPPPERTG